MIIFAFLEKVSGVQEGTGFLHSRVPVLQPRNWKADEIREGVRQKLEQRTRRRW